MAAPFFQALLRNLPLIITSAHSLYKLWTEVQGTKQENDKVIKAMQLLRSHQDDIDRFLEDPERQRMLMEGYSILVRRVQDLERRRAYGEPGRYPPFRRYEDDGFGPRQIPSFHDRENDYTGREDYKGDFRRPDDYGWRNNYREQNRYQDGDYGDRFKERYGRQEEDYGDRYRERNDSRRMLDEERQQESEWKKAKTSADFGSREKVGKLSKVKAHLLCDVCTEQYDTDHHRPILLPTCGHTFCRDCLRTISRQRHLRCPVCRSDPFMDVSSLPTNMPILSLITEETEASGENHEGDKGASCAPSAPCHDSYQENRCTVGIYSDGIMSFEEQLQYALMLSSELQEADENNSNPFAFLDEVNQEGIGILEDEQLQLVLAMSLEEQQVAEEADRSGHTWAGRTEEQQQQTGSPNFRSGREREDWWQLERAREEVRKEKERLEKEKEEWRRKIEKEKNQERARQTIRDLTKCLESDECCMDDDDEYCKEKECCSDDEDCREEECCSEDEDCLEKKCCSEEEEEEKECCIKSNSNTSEDTGNTMMATGVDPACSMTDEARLLAIVLEEEKRERRMRREKRRMKKFEEDLQLATALSLSLQDDSPDQE